MNRKNKDVSLYNFMPQMIIGGIILLVGFYLCLLASPVYGYLIPVFSAFLAASLLSFYRASKKIKKVSQSKAAFSFYNGSKAAYFAFFLYLLSVCLIFLPIYSQGGHLFVWFCAPLSALCLAASLHARRELRGLEVEVKQVEAEKKIN